MWFLYLGEVCVSCGAEELEMCARRPGLFVFSRSWNVGLCRGSNSVCDYAVKSRFENKCLWLTRCLIAQTFYSWWWGCQVLIRKTAWVEELGGGQITSLLYTYLLFQQLKDTKQVSRGAVWGLACKKCNLLGFLFWWYEVRQAKNTLEMSRLQGHFCTLYIVKQSSCALCSWWKRLEGKKRKRHLKILLLGSSVI